MGVAGELWAILIRVFLCDPSEDLQLPTYDWVPAGEGLPLDMSLVRCYFQEYGEAISGDFYTSRVAK